MVNFEPRTFLDSDRESVGHIFSGHISMEDDFDGTDVAFLDDRKGDLEEQLAAELDRIGSFFMGLSQKVKAQRTRMLGRRRGKAPSGRRQRVKAAG